MSRKTSLFVSFAAMGTAALADGLLLVLPANVSLLNLGFDLMKMKPAGQVEMLCYGGTDEVLSLERFDRISNRWLETTQSSWNAGTVQGARQDVLMIVGDSRAASDLLDSAAWADNIITPDGHSFHEIVNAVHSVSPLSKKQWKQISDKYGISMREIVIPSRYERGPKSRYSTPAPAQSLEHPQLDLTPTEVIVTAPVLADPAEAEAQLEADRKAAAETAAKAEADARFEAQFAAKKEAAEKAAAEAAAKVEAERKAAEEAAAKAAAEAAAKLEAERKAAEEAAAKAAAEAAAKLEAERKAAEEAAARAAAEAAAKLEAERKAAEEAAKRTVQQALEKAKSEVGATRSGDAVMIAAPPVDIDPAISISTPAMAVPAAPATGVKVPELPVVPAPLSIE